MKIRPLHVTGAFLFEPEAFKDNRGCFFRSFCQRELQQVGIDLNIKQSNISINPSRFTLRGFHYQKPPSKEDKVLSLVSGEIYNVIIDLRSTSPTFLEHVVVEINANRPQSLFIPSGCANAFLTLQENTTISYMMGDYFKPETYAGFRYNDPFFDIDWPEKPASISEKDEEYPDFNISETC